MSLKMEAMILSSIVILFGLSLRLSLKLKFVLAELLGKNLKIIQVTTHFPVGYSVGDCAKKSHGKMDELSNLLTVEAVVDIL